jgi:hypothetical protein
VLFLAAFVSLPITFAALQATLVVLIITFVLLRAIFEA